MGDNACVEVMMRPGQYLLATLLLDQGDLVVWSGCWRDESAIRIKVRRSKKKNTMRTGWLVWCIVSCRFVFDGLDLQRILHALIKPFLHGGCEMRMGSMLDSCAFTEYQTHSLFYLRLSFYFRSLSALYTNLIQHPSVHLALLAEFGVPALLHLNQDPGLSLRNNNGTGGGKVIHKHAGKFGQ